MVMAGGDSAILATAISSKRAMLNEQSSLMSESGGIK